jgi:hypothetical protein
MGRVQMVGNRKINLSGWTSQTPSVEPPPDDFGRTYIMLAHGSQTRRSSGDFAPLGVPQRELGSGLWKSPQQPPT